MQTRVISRGRQEKSSPVVPALVIGAGALGALYLIQRSGLAFASSAVPGGPGSGSTPSSNPSLPGGTITESSTLLGPNGPMAPQALIDRLNTSDQARQIFALQALAYSYGQSDAIPDGIEGGITDGIIQQLTGQSTGYGAGTLAAVRAATLQNIQSDASSGALTQPVRLLPFTLPASTIAAVNNSALAVDPSYPLLQVMPSNSPAGQVIPFAGYSRPKTVLPYNTVGAQPGFGAMVDPTGTNVGLWNFLRGRYHAPIGSGIVAADVNRNPVAGQPGGYWDGYPGAQPSSRFVLLRS